MVWCSRDEADTAENEERKKKMGEPRGIERYNMGWGNRPAIGGERQAFRSVLGGAQTVVAESRQSV